MSATGQSIVQLVDVPGWDPRSGDTITRRWRGTYDQTLAQAVVLRSAGVRYTGPERGDDGYYTLTAVYGASETQDPTEPLSDQWELLVNDLERSIWFHDEVVAALNLISDDDKATWRNWATQFAEGALTVEGSNGQTVKVTYSSLMGLLETFGISNTSSEYAVLGNVLKAMVKGEDSYISSQFVLRRVRTIASNSVIKPVNDNVNKVWTTEELKSNEPIPENLRFDIPDGEWLIKGKPLNQVAADKWQITEEWWHSKQWSPAYARS